MKKLLVYKISLYISLCIFVAPYTQCKHIQNHIKAQNYTKKAQTFLEKNEYKQALIYCKKALEIDPKSIYALSTLANIVYNTIGNIDLAITLYLQALTINKSNPDICKNLALLLLKKERIEKALYLYQQALTLNPQDSIAQCSIASAYLTLGDFENGFFYMDEGRKNHYHITKPLNNISDIPGNTIFIPKNWGLGDMIQFIRFAKLIKEHDGRVIVQCQKALKQILSSCPHIDQITTTMLHPKEYDKQVPIWRLPKIFNTKPDSIPNTPYLHANQTLIRQWGKRLEQDTNFKIGLCWCGSGIAKYKDIELEKFAPIAQIPGVSLYSLQKGNGSDQVTKTSFKIIDFGENFDTKNGAFMDTAAIMKNIDLVISVDTSIAHLAGALGVPIWILLPFAPDWRWMLKRTDSPWYPTMKLFRGKKRYEWKPVIQEIKQEIQKILACRHK